MQKKCYLMEGWRIFICLQKNNDEYKVYHMFNFNAVLKKHRLLIMIVFVMCNNQKLINV